VRNQDDEHNLRIVRAGGKIWQSAHIKSVYYPRGNLGQVFMQYLQYGYWKPFVMKKHRQPAALRHLAPGALVMAIGALGFLSIWGIDAARIGLALLLSCYVAFLLWAVVRIKADHRIDDESAATTQNKHQPLSAWRLAAVIATYHFSYGWGWLRGVRDVFFKKTAPAKKFGALTR
jgi:hypothetical protein